MTDRVAATLERYAMIAPGMRVGVAVSGGADSVALLHVLAGLAPHRQLRLSVLHFNHQLRGGESDGDEEFVRDLAAHYGLPFHVRRALVRRVAEETGDNLEQAARLLRREFFLEFLCAGTLDRIALGHTQSDQAETVLFRLLRGSGTAGLAGMRPVTEDGLIRPLFDVTREEVREFLTARGLPWREDSSNAERTYARNRIRLDLLPALTRDWNPALAATLAATAEVARDEEDYWRAEIDRVSAEALVQDDGAVVLKIEALRSLPRAAARRLIRRVIELAKGDLRGVDVRHVASILSVAENAHGSGRVQVPGLDIVRSFGLLRFAPPASVQRESWEVVATVPGQLQLPAGSGVLTLEVVQACEQELAASACVYNGGGTELDWGRISGGLRVRNWRPGDQYRPVGHSREIKIKLLFQQARVPLWERHRWPVILHRDAIVWAARFGPAAEYAAGAGTRAVLKVRKFENIPEL